MKENPMEDEDVEWQVEHPLAHPLTRPLIYPLTHPLTHFLTQPIHHPLIPLPHPLPPLQSGGTSSNTSSHPTHFLLPLFLHHKQVENPIIDQTDLNSQLSNDEGLDLLSLHLDDALDPHGTTHPINTPYQRTLPTHPINTPYQRTLPTHPINTPYQHTLSTHPINPPSTHPSQPTHPHSLS